MRSRDPAARERRLCELNVIEQVRHVCEATVVQDAWARGRPLAVHGWIYGLDDGLLRDLGCTREGPRDMKLATPLSEKLGLASPIIQAPMAGGPSSQELVAACSAAGALGSFGFAYTQPEEMKKQSAFVRAKTDRPFGINLFTSPQPAQIDAGAQRGALDAVAGYYKELGLPAPEPVNAPYAPDLDAQLDAVAEIRASRVYGSFA